MPDLNIEGEELDIFCRNCGQLVVQTVEQLREHQGVDCPICGSRIVVDTSEFDDGVKLVHKRLNDLFRGVK
jgi:DNA-directed RNA polymerase subunit RPC12/RpoP